ncbi:MAG: helix-hairpin-helix domain-containing protein [Eubacteriales bacterium]|nr:helix-hairpin-helix domain-containing protein [Eubacteriales bacterium]
MIRFRQAAGCVMLAACLFLAGYIAVSAIAEKGRVSQLNTLTAANAPIPSMKPRPVSGNQNGINLNTATREEIMGLPGISASLADAIITQRDLCPFSHIEDLDIVKGIGEKRVEMFREYGYTGEGPVR